MFSIDDHIILKIQEQEPGFLFFIEDFLSLGNAKSVGKALERLSKKEQIQRVARGIYAKLLIHPQWGYLQPTTQQIAESISRRDKARITPTGSAALNAMGLSAQIPGNFVYLTDGAPRTILLSNRKIVFKKASPKNFATVGSISALAIQALKAIGKENVTQEEIDIVLSEVRKENTEALQHDILLAPEWIRVILRKALPENTQHE